jgi:hypothetical protein
VSDGQTGSGAGVHRNRRIRRQQIEALMIPTLPLSGRSDWESKRLEA